MAGRPRGPPPPHSENLIDFDDQPSYYHSGARPPVNDDDLLTTYNIDNSDTAPPGRPSVSYDDFVGGATSTAGLPGGPNAPVAQSPYLHSGNRA
jgi:phospholipid-transporting ATPase